MYDIVTFFFFFGPYRPALMHALKCFKISINQLNSILHVHHLFLMNKNKGRTSAYFYNSTILYTQMHTDKYLCFNTFQSTRKQNDTQPRMCGQEEDCENENHLALYGWSAPGVNIKSLSHFSWSEPGFVRAFTGWPRGPVQRDTARPDVCQIPSTWTTFYMPQNFSSLLEHQGHKPNY